MEVFKKKGSFDILYETTETYYTKTLEKCTY